jgi:predicted transcriptional regulator
MKAVQVMLDEDLLRRLDATPEVRSSGRSAVIRRALDDYLRRRQRFVVAERYRTAYGSERGPVAGLGEEYEAWEDQGAWPEE